MWHACSVCRPNVPDNTLIQSITCSARAHLSATPIAVHTMEIVNGNTCQQRETAPGATKKHDKEARASGESWFTALTKTISY